MVVTALWRVYCHLRDLGWVLTDFWLVLNLMELRVLNAVENECAGSVSTADWHSLVSTDPLMETIIFAGGRFACCLSALRCYSDAWSLAAGDRYGISNLKPPHEIWWITDHCGSVVPSAMTRKASSLLSNSAVRRGNPRNLFLCKVSMILKKPANTPNATAFAQTGAPYHFDSVGPWTTPWRATTMFKLGDLAGFLTWLTPIMSQSSDPALRWSNWHWYASTSKLKQLAYGWTKGMLSAIVAKDANYSRLSWSGRRDERPLNKWSFRRNEFYLQQNTAKACPQKNFIKYKFWVVKISLHWAVRIFSCTSIGELVGWANLENAMPLMHIYRSPDLLRSPAAEPVAPHIVIAQ